MDNVMDIPEVETLVNKLNTEFQRLTEMNICLLQSIDQIRHCCQEVLDQNIDENVNKLSELVIADCVKTIEKTKLMVDNQHGRMQ